MFIIFCIFRTRASSEVSPGPHVKRTEIGGVTLEGDGETTINVIPGKWKGK